MSEQYEPNPQVSRLTFLGVFKDLDSVSVNKYAKKELFRYPGITTSRWSITYKNLQGSLRLGHTQKFNHLPPHLVVKYQFHCSTILPS